MALSRITEAVASFTDLTIADDLTLSDDLLLASDANIIKFGADAEVTLTHVHNTGLLLNSTSVIQFNDASQNIGAPSATVLDINATDEVEINATEFEFNGTTADINANLDVSGTIVGAGAITGGGLLTTGGNIVIPDAGNIGSASDTNAIGISSGGVVSVTATTANTSASDGALTVAGGLGVAADASVGDDLRLISDAAVLSFGADSDVTLTHVADTGLLLNSSRKIQFSGANDSIHSDGSKLILTSNSVAFSLPTADGSSGQILQTNGSGVLSFATASANTPSSADGQALGSASLEWSDLFLADGGTIQFGNDQDVTLTHVADTGILLNSTMKLQFRDAAIHISSTADGDLSIAADDEIDLTSTLIDINGNATVSGTLGVTGIATFTDDIIIGDGKTIGSASDPDAIAIGSDGDVTLTQDLELQHDGAILSFGANDEVSLTHVHDTGLLLNTTMKLQFRDAAIHISSTADGDLSIAADDEIDLTSTLIDINGNLDVSGTYTGGGTMTTGGNIVIPDDGTIGSASDTNAIAISAAGKVTLSQAALGSAETANKTGDSVALDFATYQNFLLTFTGNVTLTNPTTETVGQSGFIVIKQDGTGSRTLSIGTQYVTVGDGTYVLSTAANAIDLIPYVVQADGVILLGSPSLAFA